MHLVLWQNMLSFHQSAHIRALAATPGCEVTWVVQEIAPPERAALGWPVPDAGQALVVVDPDDAAVFDLARERQDDSVHIFSGHRAYRVVARGLAACTPTTATIGVLAERQDGRGLKGLGRLLRARHDWRRVRERISFVLAIGNGAREWYSRCGCPSERVYPYGYFMERPEEVRHSDASAGPTLRLVYIGGLRHGKGVDVLLAALAHHPHASWTLDVVGDGPEAPVLKRLAAAKGIAQRTQFHGTLSHAQAMPVLSGSDLLVLPSRAKDGWGAVVSEALMRGVPVICTYECGAAALLKDAWRGEVVKAGSVTALRDALARRIQHGPPSLCERQRIIDWSQCITGESAARYLLAVVHHARGEGPRPEVPWWD
jgi:glycosyltransferase involved in cell wall biosynthesis